jgi:hypothetical protein
MEIESSARSAFGTRKFKVPSGRGAVSPDKTRRWWIFEQKCSFRLAAYRVASLDVSDGVL